MPRLRPLLRVFLGCLILVLLVIPAVRAQGQITLAEVAVGLWPEHDQPSMLVIYDIALPEDALPAALSLRIPAAAGSPHAVAQLEPSEGLVVAPYEESTEGEWTTITLQATMPELRIEYYDPGLQKDGENRHFEYTWPGDYAVDSMVVQVQQPVGASQMRLSPATAEAATGADGLVYYTADIGSLPAGQDFKIQLDYQKAGDDLTASSLGVDTVDSVGSSGSGSSTNLQPLLPWLLGGLGLLLILGGGFWYWQSGREKAQPAPRRRRRPASTGPEVSPAEEGKHIYCHQCGKRASPGDRFCRTCGTALRL